MKKNKQKKKEEKMKKKMKKKFLFWIELSCMQNNYIKLSRGFIYSKNLNYPL